MIGRNLRRAYGVIAAGVLIFGLAAAAQLTHPSAVLAASIDNTFVPHTVTLDSQTAQSVYVTPAHTVGEFLKERGITPRTRDYVSPSADTPITTGLLVEYSPAVPVTLVAGQYRKTVVTTAPDVGAFLEEQGIQLGRNDSVAPQLSDPISSGKIIRVARVEKWISKLTLAVPQQTIHELDFTMAPRATRIIRPGAAGSRLAVMSFVSTDGRLVKHLLATRLLRKPSARVIAEGVGRYAAFARFAERGMVKSAYIAANAVEMVATAYTAACAGCSGYTASGYRAGRGIVAVDPSIIPLGAKLFIPGYGFAIAGDTGGAIHGYRIDLGFNSEYEAVQFGRRSITVYRLK